MHPPGQRISEMGGFIDWPPVIEQVADVPKEPNSVGWYWWTNLDEEPLALKVMSFEDGNVKWFEAEHPFGWMSIEIMRERFPSARWSGPICNPEKMAHFCVTKTVIEIDHEATGRMARIERERSGKSLRNVAARLGVSASFLSDLELGRRNWDDKRLSEFRMAIKHQ